MELLTFSLCSTLDVIRCDPCMDVRLLLSRAKNTWLLKKTNLPCEVTNYTFMIVRRAKKTSVCIKHDRHIFKSGLALLCLASSHFVPKPQSLFTPLSFFPLFFFFFCDICLELVPPVIPYHLQLFRPPALSHAWGALSIRPF